MILFELLKPILKATPSPMPSPIVPIVDSHPAYVLLFLTLFSISVYFFPAIIATMRQKQVTAIFVLNLFLGWTGIGWVIALVWACTHKD